MKLLGNLFGCGAIKAVGNIIDDLHTSDEERQQAKATVLKIEAELRKRQMDVNLVEAKHRSVFVAGWRPCIGWICALALFWSFILAPTLSWYIAFAQLEVSLPKISLNELYPVILGMLGLGFARSYEKAKGVSK